MEGDELLGIRESLIEMYKAGFLDAYKLNNKLKKKSDWEEMNKFYKKAFMKRFEKKVSKILKKKK